jgi:hypothetical protein
MGNTSRVCITRKQDKRFTRKPNSKVKWGISLRQWLSHAEKVITGKILEQLFSDRSTVHHCGTGVPVDS